MKSARYTPRPRCTPTNPEATNDVFDAPGRRATANHGAKAGTLNRVNRPTSPVAMMSAPPRGRRRLLTAASASFAALALAGCQWTSPLQTERSYEPGDGTSTTVGDVQVNNVLVVADTKGGPGTLVGMGVNRAAQPIEVSFRAEGSPVSPTSMTIPPGGSKQISESGGGAKTTVAAVPVEPGALLDLTVSTAGAGSNVIRVPVVLATGYYKEYAGGSAKPTSTMSITESSTSSASPSATTAPSAPATGATNPAVPEPAQTTAP